MKTPFLFAALLLPAVPAAAAGFENLDMLERRLVIALGADIAQPGGPTAPIDRRMKLAACPGAVAIDTPAMGAVALRCAEIGWRIRVPLVSGGVRTAAAQAAPVVKVEKVVRRGDPLELSARRGSFTVSTQTIAQEDGAVGDRIRVRSDPKSAPMIVEVMDSGKVRLPGFNGI